MLLYKFTAEILFSKLAFEAVVADVADVAVEALPLKAAVIVPAEKLPEASRATMVEPVLALVAFDVTVNVAAPAWFAVKVWEPDIPVPDVFIVNVPLFTPAAVEATTQLGAAAPFACKT